MEKENKIISLSIAKLAKDKGFNWPTFDSYLKGNLRPNTLYNNYDFNNDKWFEGRISAPNQPQLQKWLREVKDIYVQVEFYCNEDLKDRFYYSIFDKSNLNKHGCPTYFTPAIRNEKGDIIHEDHFDTYEEALENGLVEALKLIDKK